MLSPLLTWLPIGRSEHGGFSCWIVGPWSCQAAGTLASPTAFAHSRKQPGQLDVSGFVNHAARMHSIKISSKVDEDTWNELKALANETHQNVSGLLTEAIPDYVRRKRVRPEVLEQLERSMNENEELGKLLAE